MYGARKFLVGASCLAPWNSLCGFVTDFRLRHKFAFRFTLNLDWRQHVSRFRFFLLMYVARDTSSTPEGTTSTRCVEDMRFAVCVAVIVPYDSPDDSGVLVTFLSGLGEGAETSAETGNNNWFAVPLPKEKTSFTTSPEGADCSRGRKFR